MGVAGAVTTSREPQSTLLAPLDDEEIRSETEFTKLMAGELGGRVEKLT